NSEGEITALAEGETIITVEYEGLSSVELTVKVDDNVDKSTLTDTIEEAQSLDLEDYTEESAASLLAALENAESVVADKGATEIDVEQALDNLNAAINALEKEKPEEIDKSSLIDAIEEAQSLDLEDYTEESATSLLAALENAESVVADEEATEKDI